MAEKERKIQPTAVPLDGSPERCIDDDAPRDFGRGSLMPAGGGSVMLSDHLVPDKTVRERKVGSQTI